MLELFNDLKESVDKLKNACQQITEELAEYSTHVAVGNINVDITNCSYSQLLYAGGILKSRQAVAEEIQDLIGPRTKADAEEMAYTTFLHTLKLHRQEIKAQEALESEQALLKECEGLLTSDEKRERFTKSLASHEVMRDEGYPPEESGE